jgi:hypothetical protein
MPVEQGIRQRRNRLLGWGLGITALLMYLAIGFRWTKGL